MAKYCLCSHVTLLDWKLSPQADALQALGDAERQSYMKGKRILEINPRHPLIQQVKDKFEADPENGPSALAKILYETALLESGFQVDFALCGDVSCMFACGSCISRRGSTLSAHIWHDA